MWQQTTFEEQYRMLLWWLCSGRVWCAQGAALRAGFPKDAKNHRVYGVLDDSELQTLLKRGKAWTSKARQTLQTMHAGRPLPTSFLSDLLEEAVLVKLDLSPEVCPRTPTANVYVC